MSKRTSAWIIIAVCLILVGCAAFAGVMTIFNWDFSKLSTLKYETEEYSLRDEYKSIRIIADTADVIFVKSENGNTTVTCYEEAKEKHSVEVVDGVLVIEAVNTKKWYDYIMISHSTPKITVSLPEGEYESVSLRTATGEVKIGGIVSENVEIDVSTGDIEASLISCKSFSSKGSTGDVTLKDITCTGDMYVKRSTGNVEIENCCGESVTVKVTTGDTEICGVECKSFTSTGDTGDIDIESVVCTGKLSVERSTGDVWLCGCDGAEIFVKTDTGDVDGTLLTEKIFAVSTSTGSIDVPKAQSGGMCEIETDTGNIRIRIDAE